MNDIYAAMLAPYDLSTEDKKRNAYFEVNQQIVLAGLQRGGFFAKAAFYGGTCLRLFHGLNRFSEDMDFSLLTQEDDFSFADYFDAIRNEFALVGRTVELRKKEKSPGHQVESAFLKDTTDIYDLVFQTEKSIRIKLEVDICPPLKFETEEKLLLQPRSFYANLMTLPNLFAGKMHALVYRQWKNRVKGRDWYDFEWYVRKGVKLNFVHLRERIRQFNGEELTRDAFLEVLRLRIQSVDIERVKDDVKPFLVDLEPLAIWSTDYFLALVDKMQFAEA